MGVIAIGQRRVGNRHSAAGAFGHILPRHLDMDAASMGALGAVDGEWMAMGEQLKPGERVVTDGADKLRDGAKVDVIVPEKNQAADEKPKNAERGKRPEGGWRGQNKDSRKGGDSPDRGQRQSAS